MNNKKPEGSWILLVASHPWRSWISAS